VQGFESSVNKDILQENAILVQVKKTEDYTNLCSISVALLFQILTSHPSFIISLYVNTCVVRVLVILPKIAALGRAQS